MKFAGLSSPTLWMATGTLLLGACGTSSEFDALPLESPVQVQASGDEQMHDNDLKLSDLEAELAASEEHLLAHERAIADCMAEKGFEYIAALPWDWYLEKASILDEAAGGDGLVDMEIPEPPNDPYVTGLEPGKRAAYELAYWGDVALGGDDHGCYADAYGDSLDADSFAAAHLEPGPGDGDRSERLDPSETSMHVVASDDCRRSEHILYYFNRSHIIRNYPAVAAAIDGRLQDAYTEDPTLDLDEFIPEEHLNPLIWAIRMHCHELFDWLVDHGVLEGEWHRSQLVDPYPGGVLIEALNVDNNHALPVLLEAGHNPNWDGGGFAMLDYARSAEAAELLLAAGADPNRELIDRPIDGAAAGGRAEVVKILYPLTDNPSTAIYHATSESQIEVLKLLRDLGADIGYPLPQDHGGITPGTTAVDLARKRSDPAVIAFVEDWASDQSADDPGEQDDE